jgi:hypothetical protein
VQKLLDQGIIEEVEEASDWCSYGHFVPKPGGRGEVRLVTDYTALNKQSIRPVHGFTSAREIRGDLNTDSKVYAIFDACMGYFQLELTPEASRMTTFIVAMGEGSWRFRYKHAPMGLNSSSDHFCHWTDKVFDNIKGIHKLVDNILLEGKDDQELNERVELLLKAAREHGVMLSMKKIQ